MVLSAVFFGSTGTLVETSEAERSAFNTAFGGFDIDIFWGVETYQSMLVEPDERRRIAEALAKIGIQPETSLVDAIHDEKTSLFRELLHAGVQPRAGIVNLLEQARQSGLATALVSQTDTKIVEALLESTSGLSAASFDLILSSADLQKAIPVSDVYSLALSQLGIPAFECVAIVDTLSSGQSAQAAGIPVLYTLGEMVRKEGWSSIKDHVVNLDTLSMGGPILRSLRTLHAKQIEQRAA